MKVPCITLRNNTEWVETINDGWNVLVGADKEKIKEASANFNPSNKQGNYFGKGNAGQTIKKLLDDY